ncbi:poly-beta-hydroxybutyrate polymerase [Candidatus Paracaedimonas acanthamoebae]|nr:poly-beta-hydroxybutyrate polymerase [Candidatus Paracaedimonas acanthamoebae]
MTQGISPAALLYAFTDWLLHLSLSPGKQLHLYHKAHKKYVCLMNFIKGFSLENSKSPCIEPLPQDKRFDHKSWNYWPFNVFYQSFLLAQQWWWNATTDVSGVSQHHTEIVTFVVRQILDMVSPSNFIMTNPEVLTKIYETQGKNLFQGFLNYLEDIKREAHHQLPQGVENYLPGKNVAITAGKVVFQNNLIELIQYAPLTSKVYKEPILIVPAWIMKYYILDLSPHNSLVKHLVQEGHTVFIISWKNPSQEDAHLGLNDYMKLGALEAIKAIEIITKQKQMHGVGYCLGGTILAITKAYLARHKDTRLKTLTLLATQTDFLEPGELGLFIDESQITFLENYMWSKGYLDADNLSGAFQLLNSKDLVFSRIVQTYLLGERQAMNDLMAWNADKTRLPYRMHSEYLRKLYLHNELALRKYEIEGENITLYDITTPIFSVATSRDHVAPWRSVYKIHLLTKSEITFVLTNGGHNAGIISEPGHLHRHYRTTTRAHHENYIDPNLWEQQTPINEGSWWLLWFSWLKKNSTQELQIPPPLGASKGTYQAKMDAPGQYVHMKA